MTRPYHDSPVSFESIAYELGVSRQRVMQIYNRAMKKLERECRKAGIGVEDIIAAPMHPLAKAEELA